MPAIAWEGATFQMRSCFVIYSETLTRRWREAYLFAMIWLLVIALAAGVPVRGAGVGDGFGGDPPGAGASNDAAKEAASLGQDLKADLTGPSDRISNHGNEPTYCINRLTQLGVPGIVPLCQAVPDRAWGMTAARGLDVIVSGGRQPRPLSAAELGPAEVAALTRIVSDVKMLGARKPEQAPGDRQACVSLLLGIGARVKAALPAAIELATTGPFDLPDRARLAILLAGEEPATRRRFQSALRRGGEGTKDIDRLINICLTTPPKAAAEIQSLAQDEKTALLTWLSPDAKLTIPVLIELLNDPTVNEVFLRRCGPAALAEIRKALTRKEPLVRLRAALLLPDDELASHAAILAEGLTLPEERFGLANTLCRIGDPVIPAIIVRVREPDPTARLAAARALGWFGPAGSKRTTDPARVKSAEALAPLLGDADADVRRAALTSLGELGPAASPALAAAIKGMSEAARKELAQTVIDATAAKPQRPMDAVVGGPPMALTALERLRGNPDPVVHQAIEDIMRSHNVRAMNAQPPASGPPAREQQDLLAHASSPGLDPGQRVNALHGIDLNKSSSLADGVGALLSDPVPQVRIAAGLCLMNDRALLRSPGLLKRLLETWDHDPAPDVRSELGSHLALDFFRSVNVQSARSLIETMARNANPDQRWCAAVIFGFDDYQREMEQGNTRGILATEIRRLVNDQSPKVSARAARAAVSLCRVATARPGAGAQERLLVVQCLQDKNAEVRAASLDGIFFLTPEFTGVLASSPDPDVGVAALLHLEFPSGASQIKPGHRVPVPEAAKGLYSPSHFIRQAAAGSLQYSDPADPTRAQRGVQEILKAAQDGHNVPAAIDALNVLVPMFCGPEVPDPATHSFIYRSNGGGMPGKLPTPWPVYLTNLVKSALTGPVPNRIIVIRQIGGAEPKFLAGRWDLFRAVLTDPDATIRGEGFTAARKVTFAAAAAKGTSIPPPAPTTRPAVR
jgi:HEAT repeat protein